MNEKRIRRKKKLDLCLQKRLTEAEVFARYFLLIARYFFLVAC